MPNEYNLPVEDWNREYQREQIIVDMLKQDSYVKTEKEIKKVETDILKLDLQWV